MYVENWVWHYDRGGSVANSIDRFWVLHMPVQYRNMISYYITH